MVHSDKRTERVENGHLAVAGVRSISNPVCGKGQAIWPLDWDTRTFGIPVGRIKDRELSLGDLQVALNEARLSGFRLVYWFTNQAINIRGVLRDVQFTDPPSVQVTFGGCLRDVETQCTILSRVDKSRVADVEIDLLQPGACCSEDLRWLSREAGRYSRFHLDPRFPVAGFETLYHQWIERSIRREIADAVFVARSGGQVVGVVTAALQDTTARVGLIAVDAAARGKGVGIRLMRSAVEWMRLSGAERLVVVTQEANAPACAFYGRLGMQPVERQSVYHFWLV